jgi:hypothetical protein
MPNNHAAASSGWLDRFVDGMGQILRAIADARIPPGKTPLVPKQGTINLVTGSIGVVFYTVATHVNAASQGLGLAGKLAMTIIAAVLLFASAIVVIVTVRGAKNIVDDWKRTTSVFVVLWILSLFVFILLTWPLLLVANFNLLDKVAYGLADIIPTDHDAWVYDLTKSMICALLAGLVLIYRTRISDRTFSLMSVSPWIWLLIVTAIVGFVFYLSVYMVGAL